MLSKNTYLVQIQPIYSGFGARAKTCTNLYFLGTVRYVRYVPTYLKEHF